MIGFPRPWQQQQASVKCSLLFGTLRRCNSTLGCARLVVPTVPGHMQRQDETGRPAEGLKTSDQHRPSVLLSLHTLKTPNQALACFNFLPYEWKVIAAPTPKTLPSHCSELKARLKRIIFSPVIHSFIQSQRTWQSGWIIQKKKKKKNKERTRLWTVGDASVLTPFQPPPHPSFKPAHRVQTQKWIGSWGKRGVHQSMSNLPSPPPPSIFRPWHFLAPLPPILGYWSQSSELPFGQEAFVSKT